MDKGWDTKQDRGVMCKIQHPSICCKYMIPSQNFIFTFYYKRWHYLQGRLIPLKQDIETIEEDQIIDIEILYNNNVLFNMNIRENCTLDQVQLDLQHEVV